MKKVLVGIACLTLVFGLYLANTTVDTGTPLAGAANPATITGKIYIAGMGGHFAVADVSIDPGNTEMPITINKLERAVIGSKKTHPTHDPRIDSNDETKMFWSTYKIDKSSGERSMHIGVVDLKTNKKIKDVTLKLDDKAKWTGALYCSSGQTKDSYMPVTMTNEAYITVIDKKTLKVTRNVFLDKLGYKNNYFFFHGTNSPDMKTFALAVNLTGKWENPTTKGAILGEIDMLLLDLKKLEKGKLKVLAKNKVTGQPGGKTLTFRQDFTYDGKLLLQSAADRLFVLDAKTLKLVDEEIMMAGANHDAISTPDSDYAVLSLRVKQPDKTSDGMLQLYDINAKSVLGGTVSVCQDCHKKLMGKSGSATLCGLDANWD